MRWGPRSAAALVGLALLAGLPAQAQESRYQPWQGQAESGSMPELLRNLRALIEEADKSNAADPTFLDDLRNLANAYDNPYPVRLVFDDFRDGDFTSNPTWIVSAGTWRVDNRGRVGGLRSTVYGPDFGAGGGGQNYGNFGGNLLRQGGQGQQDSFAAIYLPVRIPNTFDIRLELASRDEGGRFDFGPYLGPGGNTAYRITYMPGAANGLVLSRATSQGTRVLGSSTGPVSLEDGRPHVIDWRRDRNGRMTVTLDGKPVIDAGDPAIRKNFDGFLVVNSGGTYWIRSLTINGPR